MSFKSLSLSRGGAVNFRNSNIRINADAAKAYFGWVGSLLVAACSVGGVTSSRAKAALVFQQNDGFHVSDGRQKSVEGKVRQLEILFPGVGLGRLDGTSTPYGANYTLFPRHYLDQLDAFNINYSINIAVGASKSEIAQKVGVTRIINHPTADLTLVEHSAIDGATVPRVGPIFSGELVNYIDFGNYSYIPGSSQIATVNPRSFYMTATSIDETETELKASAGLTNFYPGRGLQFSSGSPGWNPRGELSLLLDNGSQNLDSISGVNGGTKLYSNEILPWLTANTSLNIPEPSSSMAILSIAGLALVRRRFKST